MCDVAGRVLLPVSVLCYDPNDPVASVLVRGSSSDVFSSDKTFERYGYRRLSFHSFVRKLCRYLAARVKRTIALLSALRFIIDWESHTVETTPCQAGCNYKLLYHPETFGVSMAMFVEMLHRNILENRFETGGWRPRGREVRAPNGQCDQWCHFGRPVLDTYSRPSMWSVSSEALTGGQVCEDVPAPVVVHGAYCATLDGLGPVVPETQVDSGPVKDPHGEVGVQYYHTLCVEYEQLP